MKAEVIHHIFDQYEQFDKSKFIFRDFNNYNHGFNSEKCPLPCDYCELGIQIYKEDYSYWDSIIDKLYKYVDCSLLDRILYEDSFYKVASKSVLPYFKEFYDNNGYGFGYEFKKENFPIIGCELDLFWE